MAEGWKTVAGPSDWFHCRIPNDWSVKSHPDLVEIFSADGRMKLTIHAFWHSAKKVSPAEFLDPHTIFPRAFGLRKLAALQVSEATSAGVEGYTILSRDLNFWERLFVPNRKRQWLAWSVRRKSVCLVCTVEQTTEAILTSERRKLAKMILNTIDFTEDLVAPPDAFARAILKQARRRFTEPSRRLVGLQLAISDARINLTSFYRAYVEDPASLDEISERVLDTVDRLLHWDELDLEADLEAVRDRIMPMLTPEGLWKESLTEFVSQPWIARLRIMYVVDEQDAYWYIREGLLNSWNLTQDELHELALSNLSEYFERQSDDMTSVDGTNGPKLLMPTNADAYNSVQLLYQPFHRRLQRLLGTEFAVGIPNRDFFVAVNLKNTDMLEKVRGKVAADYQTMDHPLTDRILIVSTDGVSEYCDSE